MTGKETKRFQKKTENFVCVSCGTEVKGSGYTDHCPNCLTSVHVDNNPGDRASDCKGLMMPRYVTYIDGNYIITYQCIKCGKTQKVTSAPSDDQDLLEQLSQKHSMR